MIERKIRQLSKKKTIDRPVPSSLKEACEYNGLAAVIDREYNDLLRRNTLTYVEPHSDIKPVPCTWLFKQKPLDARGEHFLEKFRSCFLGYKQLAVVGKDPTNLYALVASHNSNRMILLVAISHNLLLEGAEVSDAYLYGDMCISFIG